MREPLSALSVFGKKPAYISGDCIHHVTDFPLPLRGMSVELTEGKIPR